MRFGRILVNMFEEMDNLVVINIVEHEIDKNLPMMIPSRQQCLSLMATHQMPVHIRAHSRYVAGIAVGLSKTLNRHGAGLNMELVEAGGLLHDIAKAHCLRTGESHALIGGQMVRRMGYPQVASIVEDHVNIADSDLQSPLTESLLVNYADKRVKHTEVVSLEERFGDLVERYGVTSQRRVRLNQYLSLFARLEEMIFAGLDIQPHDVVVWAEVIAQPADPVFALAGS